MPTSSPPATLVLDDAAVRAQLIQLVSAYSGQQSLARHLGVSQREISQAINGHRPVSKTVARALGWDRFVEPRRVRYRRRQQGTR